jgi:hypothetical protein
MGTLAKLGEEEEDRALLDNVAKLMTAPGSKFNVAHTGRPDVDAKTNFYAAKAEILAAKVKEATTKKVNPFQGKEPKGPLGGSVADDQTEGESVKLDSEASSIIGNLRNPFTGKPYTTIELRKMGFGK